jgi:hypothetical protein
VSIAQAARMIACNNLPPHQRTAHVFVSNVSIQPAVGTLNCMTKPKSNCWVGVSCQPVTDSSRLLY